MSNRGQPVIAPVFPKPLCEVRERLLVMEFFGLRPSRLVRDTPALISDGELRTPSQTFEAAAIDAPGLSMVLKPGRLGISGSRSRH